jgi:hypothetical protein
MHGCCRDAKLSVLRWDPLAYDLVLSSLHYFEGDSSLKAGRESFARPPLVVTDPQVCLGGEGGAGRGGGGSGVARRGRGVVERDGAGQGGVGWGGVGSEVVLGSLPFQYHSPTSSFISACQMLSRPISPRPASISLGCNHALHAECVQGRCAAVVMLRHQLALLPAMASEALALGMLDDAFGSSDEHSMRSGVSASVGNSFVENLGKMGIKEVCRQSWMHACCVCGGKACGLLQCG